jgi:hypothetical protein
MNEWNPELIAAIASTDDLHISPYRTDGTTFGTPTSIWSVVVDGNLYVRGYNGQNSRWYNAAVTQNAGRVRAAGRTADVLLAPVVGSGINDHLDDAYRRKYAGSPYLAHMLGTGPRSATVQSGRPERRSGGVVAGGPGRQPPSALG